MNMNLNIHVYNDMGHLLTRPYPEELPFEIVMFIDRKRVRYSRLATDSKGLGCRFYILNEGLQKVWTYTYKNTKVTIEWNLDEFNSETMRWV